MKQSRALILSMLTGVLLFASWPVAPFTFFVFIAFVPLLWLEPGCKTRGRFFLWTYLSLLVWNASSTWWMCNASLPGGISAILANSLLMCIPWMGFYNVKKRFGARIGYPALILFWMSFEYIHLNWELSWPWLTLGNVFATHPAWIQWYEYTGSSGGTLWILGINLMVFHLLKNSANIRRRIQWAVAIGTTLAIPLLISLLLSAKWSQRPADGPDEFNVVVVQPDVDPWNEKFVAGSEASQLQDLIRLSESAIDMQTALVVWPETAIPISLNEDSLKQTAFIQPVWRFLQSHPNINLLTGIEGFRLFTEENKTREARKIPGSPYYYESYNSAALFDSSRYIIYHKSRLVPGAEILPSFIRFMAPWFEKFGGTSGSYVKQENRSVLRSFNHIYDIAPAICYESIFGEFMAEYVDQGANLIAIETNDGWWGNTPGYRQHEAYARLRAIETRRWIARSANTGISCFIDPLGTTLDAQPWDKKTVIKRAIPRGHGLTFFVAHGDLLSKFMIGASILLVCWNLIAILKNRLPGG